MDLIKTISHIKYYLGIILTNSIAKRITLTQGDIDTLEIMRERLLDMCRKHHIE